MRPQSETKATAKKVRGVAKVTAKCSQSNIKAITIKLLSIAKVI
jgi:hypothetical protein